MVSFRFRARARFAPESQLRPDALRALADARQSPVPRARAFLEERAVDALSIVANPQPEKLATVRDLGLNAAGVRVVKGVSQDLASLPVDLVLKERRKRLRRSFHNDLECRRFACHTGKISRVPFLRLRADVRDCSPAPGWPAGLDTSRPSAMASSPSRMAPSSVWMASSVRSGRRLRAAWNENISPEGSAIAYREVRARCASALRRAPPSAC